MGGGNSDPNSNYKSEIDTGLAQANQPKSDLAKQLSALFGHILSGQGNGNGIVPQSPGQTGQGQTPQIPQVGITPVDTTPSIPINGGNGPGNINPFFSLNQNGAGEPFFNPGNDPISGGDNPINGGTTSPGSGGGNGSAPSSPSFSFDGTDPFSQLLGLGKAVSPLQVNNVGTSDPRLTNNQPSANSFSPLTSNASTFLANSQPNINTNISSGNPQSVIQDDAFSNAVQQILGQKNTQDIADLRSRFGAEGGASRGTPAQYAEAQLRSQQTPQIAAALGQIRQNEAGLDLSNRTLGAQSQNQSIQNALSQLGINQANNQFNAGAANTQSTTNRGMTLNDLLNQFNFSNQSGTLNSQNAQFNAGQTNQLNQNFANQTQAGQESAAGRQANAVNQLAAYIAQLSALGFPGGSGSVSASPIQPQSGGGLGGLLGGLGGLAGGIGDLFHG